MGYESYNKPEARVVNFKPEKHSSKSKYGYADYTKKERSDSMDDLLRTYIEKVNRDQSDLREDVRESERRINNSLNDSEQRMDKRLDRIEQMILEQNKKIDSLSDKVSEKLEDDRKYRHTNNIAILIGVVTTVIAMVGIYYATVSTITDIIGMLP